jgi:heme/copper-type cytochrome/quinol oxidase subunit 4
MTLQQLKDERVEQAKSKIYSELMLIIFYIVVASFCVKALYFHMDLKQCATEYIILILTPIYRSRQMGVVLSTKSSRKALLPTAAIIILMVVLLWMSNKGVPSTARTISAVLSLAVFAVLFLVVQGIFIHLERKRAEKLEHQYDDED